MYATPGRTGLLIPRKGHRPSIEQGRCLAKVRPETVRVQSSGEVRAIKEVNCVVLRHLAQRAVRGRIIGRVNSVKVGEKERRFVSPELCKSSLGLSG